ncbi:MAG: slipin family protein [Bacteroidetes bacterium]|nr:slipin family protein [Bacteroidota bacterium]
MPIILIALVVLLVWLAVSGIRVAQEYERAVIFRLGRYEATRGPGVYWNIPLIERQRKIDLRTTTVDVERQETITRDSVTVRINAVLFYRVDAPERAVVAVADYRMAVYQVALTALRNVIGQHDLDEVLRARDQINAQVAMIVDKATDPWGIKVEAVEMKDVEIPSGMQRAMAREAEAVREKRARLIKAEAEYEASLKLGQAADEIAQNPIALELRRLQTITEVGSENSSTLVLALPSDTFTSGEGMAAVAAGLAARDGQPRRRAAETPRLPAPELRDVSPSQIPPEPAIVARPDDEWTK